VNVNILTIRADSKFHASDGTIHNVIGVHPQEVFILSPIDYDIAFLKLCTDINMPLRGANCVSCVRYELWLYLLFSGFRKIAKNDFNLVMSVRLSVRLGKLRSNWTDFLED